MLQLDGSSLVQTKNNQATKPAETKQIKGVALKSLKENVLIRGDFSPFVATPRFSSWAPGASARSLLRRASQSGHSDYVQDGPSVSDSVSQPYGHDDSLFCVCTHMHACVVHTTKDVNKAVVSRNNMISQVSKVCDSSGEFPLTQNPGRLGEE